MLRLYKILYDYVFGKGIWNQAKWNKELGIWHHAFGIWHEKVTGIKRLQGGEFSR
jgi:hypothetical protein